MDELLKQISEKPDTISELTADQVTEAKEGLKQFMADVKSGEIENVSADDLAEVKALNVKLTERQAKLDEEQAEYDAAIAELEADLGMTETEEETTEEAPAEETEEAPAEEAPETPEADADGNVVKDNTIEEKEPELVTAAAEKPKMGNVANRIPKDRKPREEAPALVASADTHAGQRITDRKRLGQLFMERHKNLGNNKPAAGKSFHSVASFDSRSEFVLDDGESAERGQEVLEAVQKQARQHAQQYKEWTPDALTAALAFCAPAQPVYEQFGSVSRDGLLTLPTVTATRGRMTFPDSLSFQDLTGEAGIGSEWDGDGNKSVYTFVCPDTTTCSVVANVTIIQVNNATARFYPEAVADLNAKAMATAAQDVNARHITDIAGNAKVNTLEGEVTNGGAIVSFANNIAFHATEYREKYRLPLGSVLDAVIPHWVFDALFVDAFARDSTTEYSGVRARLAGMLSDLNIRPQFVYGYQDISPDLFGTFPNTVDVMLWEPGTVVRLDSGTLDLGVVRDSTLNATNDYQTFVETFEAICVPGHEILEINDIPICPSGATGDRVTINCAATPS